MGRGKNTVADKVKSSGGANLNKSSAREARVKFLPPPKGFSGGGQEHSGWANFILLLLLS